MAFAMAIGKVVNKFQEMKRTATGVAVWVNTLDVYKYLGAADITVQTAFGFKYMKNFMGADVVFMTWSAVYHRSHNRIHRIPCTGYL